MSQIGELLALPDVSNSAFGGAPGPYGLREGMDDDADRMYRRVSRAARHEWEPRWTTLTQRSRFRISRLRPCGTAHLMTSTVIPLRVRCNGAGRTSTRLKCRDWSGIS